MSILVITTMTGTFNARAMPRCSLSIKLAPQLVGIEISSLLAHANQPIVCCYHQ